MSRLIDVAAEVAALEDVIAELTKRVQVLSEGDCRIVYSIDDTVLCDAYNLLRSQIQ